MEITLSKIIAKAIFYASIQSSIGSVEMSSKFSVMNFSKDQTTLQHAADALRGYIIVGVIWTIGTILSLYGTYGWCGAWIGLAANAVMMAWIILSYLNAFKDAARKYNLQVPEVFSRRDWMISGLVLVTVAIIMIIFRYRDFV